MSESKSVASLSPTLLARKGGARPAMRQFQEASVQLMQEDLGWNDMGDPSSEVGHDAEVVSINGAQNDTQPGGRKKPEVLRQQEELVRNIAAKPAGRRAAFTLRLDAERHLRLRLASMVSNRSAQNLVTEALDRLLEDMPEIDSLAAKVSKRR